MRRFFTGTKWEPIVGYCRAVRSGDFVAVSGCAPVAADGGVFAPGDPYKQSKRCLEILVRALRELGAGPEHVVRTRMFVTDISRWEDYGRAHGEIFRQTPPSTSMIEVKALIDPEMMIEIEADAIVS